MKRSINKILFKIGIAPLLLVSCGIPGSHDQSKLPSNPEAIMFLHWLKGKWKSELKEGTMSENWNITDGKKLKGHSYILSGNDTVFAEWMELVQNNEELVMKIRQKNEEPVPFRFVMYDKGEFVFANMENRFPQRIIYKNPQPDFLCVRIEGTVNGKLQKEDFNFVRLE